MVRLYNHTRYPDGILREVLNFAARCAGVVGDVPVKVDESYHLTPKCIAYNVWPYRKTLIGKPTTSKDKRMIKCPIGYVVMRMPGLLTRDHWAGTSYNNPDTNALRAAEAFVDVSIHEMAHIRQFRSGQWNSHFSGRVDATGQRKKRRSAHDSRPCEIDAENTVFDVHENKAKNKRRQELALKLAMVMLESSTQKTEQIPASGGIVV